MNRMLKQATALLLVLLVLNTAKAQLQWAIKGGGQVSYASIRKDNDRTQTSPVGGANLGLIAKIYFEERLAFVSGIQYSLKGYKTKPSLASVPAKTYTFHYAELPLMMEIDFKSKEKGDRKSVV